MGTRIEILKDGLWQVITLANKRALKYNAVINKIGKVDTREISHSNTFSIPKIDNNIRILGLEFANQARLAKALNSKYPAKYYVDDKLLRIGFVIINNTIDDEINLNFIDEALSIVDHWGSTSFKDLLLLNSIDKPADYQTAIDELRNYDANINTPLQSLGEVGTRGYKLCEFPNTLNVIGDKFQLDVNEQRVDDTFNPYQSRPIFNAKAILDLAVESFGYTPIYDDTINLEKIEKTYIVGGDLEGDDLEDGGFLTFENRYWCATGQYGNEVNWQEPNPVWGAGAHNEQIYEYLLEDQITPYSNALKPSDIPNWTTPPKFHTGPYVDTYCIIKPTIAESTVGQIIYGDTFNDKNGQPNSNTGRVNEFIVYAIWENTSSGQPPILVELDTPDDPDSSATEYFIDKSDLQDTPAGAGDFIGLIAGIQSQERPRNARNSSGGIVQIQVEDGVVESEYYVFGTPFFSYIETVLPTNIITFDEQGQYIADQIDLTFGAPVKKLKELVSSIAQKESLLIDINAQSREVKFFSYELYARRRVNGIFADWSDFLLKGKRMSFNTNYGNSYGKSNEISLTSPYRGNIYRFNISNAFDDVKYKDVGRNQVQLFKDVTKAIKINYTNSPYIEFSTSGLSMVEVEGEITNFIQTRFDTTTQGTIPSVAQVVNVNYATVSTSTLEWYNLLNTALRVDAQFLLPVQEVSNFRLDTPVYVEDLGGYYIVEEISEYADASTPVRVKLIKINLSDEIITSLRSIILNSVLTDSIDIATAEIDSVVSFTGLLPTSADIYYQFTDAGGADIGSPTIVPLTIAASSTPPTFEITKQVGQSQYIKVYVIDDTGLQSNVETFEIIEYVNPGFTTTADLVLTQDAWHQQSYDLSYEVQGGGDGTGLRFRSWESKYTGSAYYNENGIEGDWGPGNLGTSDLPTAPATFSFSFGRDIRHEWRQFSVEDTVNGNFSEPIVIYDEGKYSAQWRILGDPAYEPDDQFVTVNQIPSAANGFILKMDCSFTDGFAFGRFQAVVLNDDDGYSSITMELPREDKFFPDTGNTQNVIVDGIYDFDLSGTDFSNPGNYRVQLVYDTSYTTWAEFIIS